MSYCNCPEVQSWSDLYLTNFFTTFGQLSAVIVSGTVAVKVIGYYQKTIIQLMKERYNISDFSKQNEEKEE